MVFVRMLSKLLRDKEIGEADRADRSRRGAHLRHGGALPRGRHLLARRPEVRAGRHGHAPLLQGSAGRADPRGGHHRGGIDVVVHRRRHRLRDARRQHDPVLHLLLDVRLPARRRPDLGGRRLADARLPARRHRRPHDARRRGAAAPGRPQPRLSLSVPNCVSYDPAFAYELAVIIQDGIRRMYASRRASSTT